MSNIHMVQVGKLFKLQEYQPTSSQNVLEYDFIVTTVEGIKTPFHGHGLGSIRTGIENMTKLMAINGVPLVLFCDTAYTSLSTPTAKITIWDLLGVTLTENTQSGTKIDLNKNCIFHDFLKKYESAFAYNKVFSSHPGISVGMAKGQQHAVGFYTKSFVVLPQLSVGAVNEKEFLTDLYDLCEKINTETQEATLLPEWTSNYLLPGEKDEKTKLESIEAQIQALEVEKMKSAERLSAFQPIKQLWTSTGNELENMVSKAFEELGFKLHPTTAGRSDIQMEWKGKPVVVEVKGVTKSAAEKNAAQLEKWVSIHMEQHEVQPKAFLIVNTFRNIPLAERLESSFPSQMLPYSKNREHMLMTTLQLCNMLFYVRKHPDKKEELVDTLISTVGVLERFDQWSDSIEVINSTVQKK